MTVDDAPTNAPETEKSPAAAEEPAAAAEEPAATVEEPAAAVEEPAAAVEEPAAAVEEKPAPAAAPAEEPAPAPEPAFDPETCKAIAIGLPAFWEAVHEGEFSGTDFQYYLEPAGVLSGPLVCTRAPEEAPEMAGLLMTRAGWQAKKLCLDDDVNPETYELSFPKEFGYVKTVSHYEPETRKSAKYPWSKKY